VEFLECLEAFRKLGGKLRGMCVLIYAHFLTRYAVVTLVTSYSPSQKLQTLGSLSTDHLYLIAIILNLRLCQIISV
jgi:hypothetical protein